MPLRLTSNMHNNHYAQHDAPQRRDWKCFNCDLICANKEELFAHKQQAHNWQGFKGNNYIPENKPDFNPSYQQQNNHNLFEYGVRRSYTKPVFNRETQSHLFGSCDYGKKVYQPKSLQKYDFYDYMKEKHLKCRYTDESDGNEADLVQKSSNFSSMQQMMYNHN